MSWTKLDDRWTDSTDFEDLPHATRWHYLAMIQFCSRTEKFDGVMRYTDARRCSDVDDPNVALDALASAGLLRLDEDRVHVLRIEDHVPPPSVRKNAEQTKVRMQRMRKHKNGDHSMCSPEKCPHAPGAVTGPVTRNTGTGQDGTGRALTGESSASASARNAPTAPTPDVTASEDYSTWDVAPIPSDEPEGVYASTSFAQGDVFVGASEQRTYCRAGGCAEHQEPGSEFCAGHAPDRVQVDAERSRQLAEFSERFGGEAA